MQYGEKLSAMPVLERYGQSALGCCTSPLWSLVRYCYVLPCRAVPEPVHCQSAKLNIVWGVGRGCPGWARRAFKSGVENHESEMVGKLEALPCPGEYQTVTSRRAPCHGIWTGWAGERTPLTLARTTIGNLSPGGYRGMRIIEPSPGHSR